MKSYLLSLITLLLILTATSCGKKPEVNDKDGTNIRPTRTELYTKALKSIEAAIEANDVEAFKKIISDNPGFNLNELIIENGETLLTVAIKNDLTEIRDFLIERGADLEKKNVEQMRPLFISIRGGFLTSVKILLDKKVDLEERDPKGNTPLHFAIKNKRDEIALLLINHGAKIESRDLNGKDAFSLAEIYQTSETFTYLQSLKEIESSAPDIASFREILSRPDYDQLVLILNNHPKIIEKNNYGSINPLALLVGAQDEKLALKSMNLLLDHNADVNGPERADYSPLIKATISQKISFASLFLDKGKADPELFDKDGKSALIHAVELNHLELVKLLVSYRADEKYTTFRRIDGKKVSFNACSIAKSMSKTLTLEADKKKNEKIKDALGCWFFDWPF